MPMLTQDDLKAIGQIIDEKVPPIVRTIVQEVIDDPEGTINIKLDAMQEQLDGLDAKIDSVENRMVTRDYLDRKLTDYVRKTA